MTAPNRLRRILMRTGAIFTTLAALSAPALALTTYTYTAPWTYWANSWGAAWWPSYADITQNLTFEFTTAAPLTNLTCGTSPANCQVDVLSQVQSWRYNGGSSFLNLSSDLPGSLLTGLFVSTDSLGSIQDSRFYVEGIVNIPSLPGYPTNLWAGHQGYDTQLMQNGYMRQYSIDIYSRPLYAGLSEGMSNGRGAGQWTMANSSTVSAIPEPETLALMLMGLGLLAVSMQREKLREKAV